MFKLEQIKQKTQQEIFDIVVTKLLKQKKKSICNDECMYRRNSKADCRIKCAAGHLIENKVYNPLFEGKSFDCVGLYSNPNLCYAAVMSGVDENMELCRKLQSIHDDYEPSEWKQKFTIVAVDFSLKMPKVKR